MIVGTAGHIDHGKTTLVRALTGVDTDRLPEEKKRGISIELGYAFLDTPQGGRIGFIDVPGHEKLVHTMLAGATGIDHALLLVAADDGPMPQTREHLAVLSLLGIRDGAVVVTKADRVAPERVRQVLDEARRLVGGTPLAHAPVLAVSAVTGEGLPALRDELFGAAARRAARAEDGRVFRLAVDRSFVIDGVGTVATGTVFAGRVALGDELALVPGGRRVRVRSVHADNRAVAGAAAGQRCALGLAGASKDDVQRGQWLVALPPVQTVQAADAAAGTQRIDAELTLWHEEKAALRSGALLSVHAGAAQAMATLAVLDAEAIAPGASARVQLILRAPLGAWHGDRVVVRDPAASRTLAGGRVLDPQPPARYRRTPQRLAELDALGAASVPERAAALLAVAPQGLDLARFAAAQGVREIPAVRAGLRQGDWALGAAQAEDARGRLLAALAAYHEREPDELGPDTARARRLALPRLPEPLYRALLGLLLAEGAIAQRGAFVHLPAHGVKLSASEERIAQKVAPRLAEAGFDGAWARDLARDAQESEPLTRTTLSRLAQRGELHQVVKDLFYAPAQMARLAAIARGVAAAHEGAVTAAAFRDATQLGRKRAIQVLEHFDRIGLLRRVGDLHKLRSDCALFMEGP
jgi:selenocysteine-specific elongation factor